MLCCQVQAPAPVKPAQCTINNCDVDREFCGLRDTDDSLTSVERRSSGEVVHFQKRTGKSLLFTLASVAFRYNMRRYPSRSELYATPERRNVVSRLYYYLRPGRCPSPQIDTRTLQIEDRAPTDQELPRELETEHVEDVRIQILGLSCPSLTSALDRLSPLSKRSPP